MALTVESTSIADGQPIPETYAVATPTADGKAEMAGRDLSPHLRWSGEPEGTRSFAISVVDPDVPADRGRMGVEGLSLGDDEPRAEFAHWLVVDIPAGVHDGSRIRLAGKGEAGFRGGPRGDLYVTTRVTPSPVFRQRPDGNLEVDLPVTVSEAIQGATIEVPTLDGTKRIRIPPGTKHGSTQRLRGEGPPKPKGGARGDIYYRIQIEIPKELTDEQREAVEKLGEAFNGHDPRASLLGRAARSGAGGKVRADG